MTAHFNLTNSSGVEAYLATPPKDFPLWLKSPARVARLSGGSGNFTYRITFHSGDLRNPERPASVIFKSAEAYVASMPDHPLSLKRWDYERLSMGGLRPICATPFVRLPKVYYADHKSHVLIIEDAGMGSLNLKELFLLDDPPTWLTGQSGGELGTWLGSFLAGLHGKTARIATDGLFENETARQVCAWRFFERLVETAAGAFALNAAAKEALEALCRREAARIRAGTPSTYSTVTMGDFWTGNILTTSPSESSISAAEFKPALFVVDWELAHASGCGGVNDIAQFTAEAYLSWRFAKTARSKEAAREMLKAFHTAYGSERGFREGARESVMLAAGAHIATLVGVVGWTQDVEVIRRMQEVGLQMVRLGDFRLQRVWEPGFTGLAASEEVRKWFASLK